MKKDDFIEKARKIHGDKYDYSKVEYINNNTKVCIICPIHGEFWQTPHNHLAKHGCPKCSSNNTSNKLKLTTEEFIEKAKKIHGNKYNYSKVNYINAHTKVCIICPIHGEFWQTPNSHLEGQGCRKCGHDITISYKKLTTEEFIERARKIHGDKYDYSKVNYIDGHTKVCIICPIHGEFWQLPHNHLEGKGCRKCSYLELSNKESNTTEEFIEKAKTIHGVKYDYSKVTYINNHTKVCIICPIHGEFWQSPSCHLRGNGCPKCGLKKIIGKRKLSTEEFIERARKIHGDKYDYSKVNYISIKTKVCIICPIHGEFWQTPDSHLRGQGCLLCGLNKSLKEIKLKELLTVYFPNEEIIYQAHLNWLGHQSFDFYLPKYKLAIEYQGDQHFKPIKHFGGDETFLRQIKRDLKKMNLSKENNVTILYITLNKNNKSDYYNIFYNFEDLFHEIRNYIKNGKISIY